ncbi:MAG: nuclear transport factor 2 family protein [Actinomycetes bacterium]
MRAPEPVDPADRDAVVALLAAYADAIDAGDFPGVADLLAGAVVQTEDGAVVAQGREQVLALYEATTVRHADGTPRTAHLVTNVVIERGDGPDHLRSRSRFVVLQATERVPLQPVVAGRYEDEFVRSLAGWQFAVRRMVPQLWGDVSDHLTFDPR